MGVIVEVAARVPVPVGLVRWRRAPTVTAIVKTTFDLHHRAEQRRVAVQPPLGLERHDDSGGLIVPSDFSPQKTLGCDFVVVGASVTRKPGPLRVVLGDKTWIVKGADELGPKRIAGRLGDPTDASVVDRWDALPADAFQVAPSAQRMAQVERFVNLEVDHPEVASAWRLDTVAPALAWVHPARPHRAITVSLSLDAICLDLSQRQCSLVWRGVFEAPSDAAGFLAVDPSGQLDPVASIIWSRYRAVEPEMLHPPVTRDHSDAPLVGARSPMARSTLRMRASTAPMAPAKTMRLVMPASRLPLAASPQSPIAEAPPTRVSSTSLSQASFPEDASGAAELEELERTYDLDDASEVLSSLGPQATYTQPVGMRAPMPALPFRDSQEGLACPEMPSQTATGIHPEFAPPLPFVLTSGAAAAPLGYSALGSRSPPEQPSDLEHTMTIEGPLLGSPAPLPFAEAPRATKLSAQPRGLAAHLPAATPFARPEVARGAWPTSAHQAERPGYLQREVQSSITQDAEVEQGQRIEGLSVDEYADVKAALWGPSVRQETLKRHGMTELRWRLAERAWERLLASSSPEVLSAMVTSLQVAARQHSEPAREVGATDSSPPDTSRQPD